jgi:ubiquitin carboxyl-terminal hydrolase 25/28
MFYLNTMQNYPDKTLENKEELEHTLWVHLESRPPDIYGALDKIFGLDSVDHANGTKVDRYITIEQLPPILQIYFQRQSFSITKDSSGNDKTTVSAIKHHVKLEETIYMDRYVTPSPELPELAKLSSKSRDLTRQLRDLEKQQARLSKTQCNLIGPDVLEQTWQYINSVGEELDDVMAVQEDLQKLAEKARKDLERVEEDIKALEEQRSALDFEQFDSPQNCYKLFAVFVHSGTAGYGHYWAYIRDFRNNVWRSYNDEKVSEVVDTAEIFREYSSSSGSYRAPYFVAYVRDDQKDEMADPFDREKPEPSVANADVEMADTVDDSEFQWQEVS